MSYPYIDPNTYLRIQDHDHGISPKTFVTPRLFRAGSWTSAIIRGLGVIASTIAIGPGRKCRGIWAKQHTIPIKDQLN